MSDKIPFKSFLKSEYVISDSLSQNQKVFSERDKKRFDVSLVVLSLISVLCIVVCAVYYNLSNKDVLPNYTVSGSVSDNAQSDTNGGLININTADATALCSLSGIGEARALDIISYRLANGNFERIEDIKKVSGIKDATFNKIKDFICV